MRSDAATHVISLLVAGVMLAAGVGTVVYVTLGSNEDARQQAAHGSLDARADALAAVLLDSTGQGWYGASASCLGAQENRDAFDPDQGTRFGPGYDGCNPLRSEGAGVLSFDKLADLQRSGYQNDATNDHLDYLEARQALGLDRQGQDFHIRTQPVLASLRQILETSYQDPNIKAAYIGDYVVGGGGVPPGDLSVSAGIVESAGDATLYARIVNNGLTTTVFETTFEVPLADRTLELTRHTPEMPPAAVYNVTVTLPKTSDWEWATPEVGVLVSDPLQVLHDGSIDAGGIDMVGTLPATLFSVHAGKIQYEAAQGADPKVYYEAYDGRGNPVDYSNWKLEVFNSLGVLVASDTNLHARGWEAFSLPLPDVYTIKLRTLGGLDLATSKTVVVNAALGGFSTLPTQPPTTPALSVVTETAFIDALIQQYQPGVFSSDYDAVSVPYVVGGDVYPDLKTVMNNDLPAKLIDGKGTPSPNDDEATLVNYNMLIVGSNVDHQVMTSQAAKESIRAWVYGGGVLIVLGSADQSVQWLQPIFHSALQSGSGGISAPDETHPVLDTPNSLDWESFDSHGVAWSFTRSQDEEHFTHVVRQGDDDILALSDHGEFGEGRVLLSAWQAWDLVDGAEPASCDPNSLAATCPGLLLVHNLITQYLAGLFVDFGPAIPEDRPQGVSHRVASVHHPELAREVSLHFELFVF